MRSLIVLILGFGLGGVSFGSGPICWQAVLRMLDPERPPLEQVTEQFRAVIREFPEAKVFQLSNFDGIGVTLPTFATAVLFDSQFALTGVQGYPVIVELEHNPPLPHGNVDPVLENMLFSLTPEGAEAYLTDSRAVMQDHYNRDLPRTFKIGAELRAMLASDQWRLKRWDETRPLHFLVRNSSQERLLRHLGPDWKSVAAYEKQNLLHPAYQEALAANFREWNDLETRWVKTGRATIVLPPVRNGSDVTLKVVLKFATRESVVEFLEESGVSRAYFPFPDAPPLTDSSR